MKNKKKKKRARAPRSFDIEKPTENPPGVGPGSSEQILNPDEIKLAGDHQEPIALEKNAEISKPDESKSSGMPNPDEIDANQAAARKYIKEKNAADKKAARENDISPTPAEPQNPIPAETPPKTGDQNAAVQKQEGASFPMPSIRPQPPQTVKEEGSVIVSKALAEQLGTSPEIKSQMRIDERKMAVLTDGTLAALSHFSYRHVYDGVRYWGHITEWWLTGSQGIGGLGRRHILQALANTSGVQVMDKAEKPNALARNIWDRNWKEKAAAEGKVVEE